jgi:predicted RNA-binding Zn ribbon-like protein
MGTLKWVRDVRGALRAVLVAAVLPDAPMRRLNDLLGQVTAVPQVDGDGQLRLHAADDRDEVRLAVASLAIAACALPPARVRECANPKCVLVFFDSSKNGTRRWHRMATCGNRAKAAAHHERRRTSAGRSGLGPNRGRPLQMLGRPHP